MDMGRRREGETYGKSNMESYMAIAKLCQSCPTLCNPIDSSPPGSALPGILQEHWSGLPFPSLESYITLCKINSQGEFAVCLRKLKQGSASTSRVGVGREMGWWFKREGAYVHLLQIHVEV